MDPFVKVGAMNRYIVFFSWTLLVRCVDAQSFANIAALLNSPQISNSLDSTITVFKFSNQSVQFDKAKFQGIQRSYQRLILTGNDPPHHGTIEEDNSSAKLIMETDLPVNQKVGIYTITISEGSETEQLLRVVLLNQNPPITPVEYSTVVVRGQEAQVSVSTSEEQSTLRWRRNGRFCNSKFNDCTCSKVASCTVATSELSDSFVMESFIAGGYQNNTHAIMNVIIRECDVNHWGTNCTEECPRCLNGGVCSDKHGTCICPPGFSGQHCETVRGRNVFGQNGEFRCDEDAEDDATSCQGSQICYPNPFGCACPAGYSGLGCMTECSNSKFGADCKQDCHCADGSGCASDTGVCSNGICAEGFKGVNCQVEDPCHVGSYGNLCTLPCSCFLGNDCQDVEDNCERGCAEPWTGLACDNNTGSGKIEFIDFLKVNVGITTTITCTAIRNPILESQDLILTIGDAVVTDVTLVVPDDREYRLTSSLEHVLMEPVTIECSIRGIDVKRELSIAPYELLYFASNEDVLLSSNVTPTTIELSWRAWNEDTDHGDGPVVNYQIKLGVDGMENELLSNSTLSYQFDDLWPDTDYRIMIAVVREGLGGMGRWTTLATITTPCGVPAAPTLDLSSSTSRGAIFAVQYPSVEERNCRTVSATLQQRLEGGNWENVTSVMLDETSIRVEDLIPCSSYRYRVQISSTGGEGNSGAVDVETKAEAQSFANIAVLLNSPLISDSLDSTITVFKCSNQTVQFDKAEFQGSQLSDQRFMFTGNDPPHHGTIEEDNSSAKLIMETDLSVNQRVGIYTITISECFETEQLLRVVLLNQDAPITPVEYSTVVVRGQEAQVSVSTSVEQSTLRWRRDGRFCRSDPNDCTCFQVTSCTVPTSELSDSFVMESFIGGGYSKNNNHAIMNVIIRECDFNHWGTDCAKECPRCFNGGICSDKHGTCICPPGFSGRHCETVHGRNVFGQNGEFRCDEDAEDDTASCQGSQICYPNPFGCACPAGYSGLGCMTECSDSKFGADCKQDCHCADGSGCASDTGVCSNGICAEGFKGVNCQVENPCHVGTYGDLCTLPCSCSPGDNCQEVKENCERGCEEPWTGLACDNNTGSGKIELIDFVKVNEGISTKITCTAIRNPILESQDLILTFGDAVVSEVLSVVTDDREYSLTNSWDQVLIEAVTIECSIRGIDVKRELRIAPYELPYFGSDEDVLLSSNVTPTTIELSWRAWNEDIDGGQGPVVNYRIKLGEDGMENELLSNSTLSYQFDDLWPDTDYRIMIAVVREGLGGMGRWTTLPTITTACGVPAAPTLHLSSSTSRGATLAVQFPSVEERNCRTVSANLQQRLEGGNWENVTSTSVTLDETSIRVRDLIPCSSYRYRVQISSTGGEGNSEAVDVETEAEALEMVRNLQAFPGESPATLRLTWESPDMSDNRCPLVGYVVRYEPSRYITCSSSGLDGTARADRTLTEEYIIQDLEHNAQYSISVVAVGTSNSTEKTIVGDTSFSVPSSPPRNVILKHNTSTSLTFEWKELTCSDRNGDIIKYGWRLTGPNGSVVTADETGMMSTVVTNLVPYTSYSLSAQAFTEIGPGPFSDPLTTTTLEDVPPQMEVPVSPFGNLSSIQVKWTPPSPPHGMIIQYDICYQPVDESQNETILEWNLSQDLTEELTYLITNLDPNSNYSVKVRAYTSVGSGVWSLPLHRITAEGVPGPPSNLRVEEGGLTHVTILWDVPRKPQGNIGSYKIEYRAVYRPYESSPCGRNCEPLPEITIDDIKLMNSHQLNGLDPSTIYEIKVRASTSAGYGEPAVINATTQVFTDLQPANVDNIDPEREGSTAVISLPPLEQTYATGYLVRVKLAPAKRRRAADEFETFADNSVDYIAAELVKSEETTVFTVGDNKTYGRFHNAPLMGNESYELYIITVSSVNGTMATVSGPAIILYAIKEVVKPFSPAFVIILTILVVLIVVCVLVIVIYKRKSIKRWRESKAGERVPEQNGAKNGKFDDINLEMSASASLDNLANSSAREALPSEKPSKKKSVKKLQKAINLADLATYVKTKKSSRKDTLAQEYEMLTDGQLFSCDVASKPENKTKNRYGNIIPYDHSRVVLATINNDPHSDYISASYIDGYKSPRKYIACHGPNKASVKDFWRMVWQENCGIIVMLTNVSEGGKRKCEKYWPDGHLKYGHLKVDCTSSVVYASYTIRTFSLSQVDDVDQKIKTVTHYHFTAWPDMKVPEFAGPILSLLHMVRDKQAERVADGPIVVHCSAGVGRTGTFITLDAMLDMAAAENKINVPQFVNQMRKNRIKMVQVVEQYQFIYDALVEYFVIGVTAIPVDELSTKVSELKSIDSDTGKTYLQKQYETLELVTIIPPAEKFTGGNTAENKCKNRFQHILPVDTYRPYLMTDVGDRGNNYINASFLSGFQKKDMFLGTQMPLDSTIIDFWRMVWDYNSPAIVMLNKLTVQMSQYWPDSDPITCGPFTISVLSCKDQGHVRIRQLHVTNASQTFEEAKSVSHLQCLEWPEETESPKKVLLVTKILNQLLQNQPDGPLVVHCIDGVGRTGMFCSLLSAMEQINKEKVVDVFQLVNKMRSCQPSILQNFEQYQFIYDALLAHLDDDDNIYENYVG